MSESTDTETTQRTAIPTPLGERLQTVLALDDRPRTLTEWGEAIGDIADREGIKTGIRALCTTDESPHAARFDGITQHFLCVQDAFIVPYVTDDVETVEITTESPTSGDPIEITVTDDRAETDPPSAVLSVGVAADATAPPAETDTLGAAYGQICPYGNAFRTREEYEQWAGTVDAVTMATPVEDALRLAAAIGEATG